MFLIVGLGNPGKQYLNSRHNVGFIAIDYLINCYNFLAADNIRFNAEIIQGIVKNNKIFLAKPLTYMNLSGKAISSICAYYKIHPRNILVIHDDIDLEIGKVKFKFSGGSGGHNGIKSIDQYIGNAYYRIRIGVGRPINNKIDISDHVLGNFSEREYEQIMFIINKIVNNLDLFFSGNIEEFKEKLAKPSLTLEDGDKNLK